MLDNSERHTRLLTRRQALARGAAIGGAVWTVPAVSVISMTSAHAASPSGPPKPPGEEPPVRPPANKPPANKPPANKPPAAGPPDEPSAPPEDEPAAGPTLPKTGADGVSSSVTLGAGLTATGAALYIASRKLGGSQDDA